MKPAARLAVVTLLLMLVVSSLGCPKPPIQVTVPVAAGLSRSAAGTAIRNAGLAVGTVSEVYSGVAAGQVISQSLPAGTSVAAGTAVDLVVSLGSDPGVVSGAIPDVRNADTVPTSEISEDGNGLRIARTKLTVVFHPSATAGQMNALLDSLGAEITCSLGGTWSIVVRIPDPGDLAAYETVAASVGAESFVQFVIPGEMPKPQALPEIYSADPPDLNELGYLDHHLAVRAHAAWNAKAAIRNDPHVLVVDDFGAGPPLNDTIDYYGGMAPDGTPDFSALGLNAHGYHVLGIMAGTFGRRYATGMFPGTVSLRALDLQTGLDWGTVMHETLRILRDEIPGKVIVNTSIGYGCDGTGGDCIGIVGARQRASLWIEYVRWFGLEDRVLHVAAAGNIDTPPGPEVHDARTSSPFTSARLLDGLTDSLGTPLANLSNTLVIENATDSLPEEDFVPYVNCLAPLSFTGGDLAAIGAGVWSFTDNLGAQDNKSGTSMATPQVAGLAAYLWSIDPNPTPQQLVTLLLSTSEPITAVSGVPGCSDCPTPAPAIDAYSALLALDAAAAPTPADAPVRHAIVDVDDDGKFDEDDVTHFIIEYYEGPGCAVPAVEPAGPNYGRFDLNGDGWTGGQNKAPFDLNRIGSVRYGPSVLERNVRQTIGGIEVSFDENQVRDMDALCYYAYSGLYEGDTAARDAALICRCKPPLKVYAASYDTDGEDPFEFPNHLGFGEVRGIPLGTPPGSGMEWRHSPPEGLPGPVALSGTCRVRSPFEFLPGTTTYHGTAIEGASVGVTVDFSGDSLSLEFESHAQGNALYDQVSAEQQVVFYIEILNDSARDRTLEITFDNDVKFMHPEVGISQAGISVTPMFVCGGNSTYPPHEYIDLYAFCTDYQEIDYESSIKNGYWRGTVALTIPPGYHTLFFEFTGGSAAEDYCTSTPPLCDTTVTAETKGAFVFRLLP